MEVKINKEIHSYIDAHEKDLPLCVIRRKTQVLNCRKVVFSFL